jgi:hypothetical protein
MAALNSETARSWSSPGEADRRLIPPVEEELPMSEFYDQLASLYHLIFQNWDESIERQAVQLTSIIRERWGAGARTLLDVSCGIGTQALGLTGLVLAVLGALDASA